MADPVEATGAIEESSNAAASPSFSELAAAQVADMQGGGQQEAAENTADASRTTPAAETSNEDVFYDSTNIPPELEATYKQFQKAYTQKTQALANQRQKIEAYDQFMSNPHAALQQLAQQHGYQLSAGQTGVSPDANREPEPWEPNTWEDVLARAEERAEQRVLQSLSPMLQELRGLKKTAIEQQLDAAVPDWRQYEDEFAETIRTHPTLVNDPAKLARIAMPDNVLESRAMQAALKRLKSQQASAEVGGGSENATQAPSGAPPTGATSFQQAVEMAAEHLRAEGTLYR